MRIAYLHRLSFEDSEKRFFEEAAKIGVELVPIKYRQLRVSEGRVMFGELDLVDFDGWYFRAVGTELEWAKILELYAKENNVKVVDQYLLTQGPLRRAKSVMGWQLSEAGVNYPKTVLVESFEDLKKELSSWTYPVIVKMSQGGRHGMSTFFLKQESDINGLEEKLEGRRLLAKTEGKGAPSFRGFLIQEYIPNDGDYRVMTVGYRCIGGFKRAPKEEKLVMNKSVGKSVLVDLPNEVKLEAEKAAKAVEVEIAGIDLVVDKRNGKVYVVEVNEAPQFKVFEKRTRINAAGEIVSYLKEKFGVVSAEKVLVLGRFAKEYEPKRILEEARKKGRADLVKYGAVKLTEEGVDLGDGRSLTDYDLIVPRSASKRGSSMVTTKTVILQEAERLKIKTVNGKSFSKYPLLGKIEQGRILAANGLPTIPYISFGSKNGWKDLKVSLPAIFKGRFGSHGRTVKLVKTLDDLREIIEVHRGENVLVQPVLPIKVWFRAIVCWGKYLGEMKHKQKDKYKDLEHRIEKTEIGDKNMQSLKSICLKAAKLFDCDYCGIDVGWREDTKSWVIFEVNRTAQFKYFEKRVGVNVAGEILGYNSIMGERINDKIPLFVEQSGPKSADVKRDLESVRVDLAGLEQIRAKSRMVEMAGSVGEALKDVYGQIRDKYGDLLLFEYRKGVDRDEVAVDMVKKEVGLERDLYEVVGEHGYYLAAQLTVVCLKVIEGGGLGKIDNELRYEEDDKTAVKAHGMNFENSSNLDLALNLARLRDLLAVSTRGREEVREVIINKIRNHLVMVGYKV